MRFVVASKKLVTRGKIMNVKELELPGLKLVDSNAVYSGTQNILIDFEGAENVSYDNETLGIHLSGLSIADSGLSGEKQAKILNELNSTFTGTGVIFTTDIAGLEPGKYSTIYVGGSDPAFSAYGNFRGLSETIGAGNQVKNDNAFVFTDKLGSTAAIVETIAHEAAHLVGFQHDNENGPDGRTLSSYANGDGLVPLKIVNNFSSDTTYYSVNYSDEEVWLYFTNTDGYVSYIDTTTGLKTVTDNSSIQLSTVLEGTFFISYGSSSSTLYAAFGTSTASPFSTSSPGTFDTIAYSLLEWTIVGGENDNVDVSYLDTVSYPTTLRVRDSTGNQVDRATFKNNTTESTIVDALEAAIATKPVGPTPSHNYPSSGDIPGWGPQVAAMTSDPTAMRWLGSSQSWASGSVPKQKESLYLYVPSFNDYLGYLQDHETDLFSNGITGWYIDYSGNGGYSFYVSVTGTDEYYGLQVHDVRYNAGGAAPDWKADPTAGTALNGTVSIEANNATITIDEGQPTEYYLNANWTDATLYTGAFVQNGVAVTTTGDFSEGGIGADLVATILASLSGSIDTGLLGNSFYMDKISDITSPGATMYWFNTLERDQYDSVLFSAAWTQDQVFYDPYWSTMASLTDMQGYLSTFNDRWKNFSPDFGIKSNYSIVWELGVLPLSKMAPADFVGNGKSDILFTNATEQTLGYYTDGDPTKWVFQGGYASGWEVAGSGDFDGFGTSSVLFSNGSDIGYYEGADPTAWNVLGSYAAGWNIAGVGDFDANGVSDILFTSDDNRFGCYMDGQPSQWRELGSFASGWDVAGIGDFNGDDCDDVLCSNGSETGYYAGGALPVVWTPLDSYAAGWDIAGVGDFDGDGEADVLFSNGSEIGYYASGKASGWTPLGSYSAGWEIAGVADFDRNGKSDILFNNAINQIGYYADGLPSEWKDLGSFASGWQIAIA